MIFQFIKLGLVCGGFVAILEDVFKINPLVHLTFVSFCLCFLYNVFDEYNKVLEDSA